MIFKYYPRYASLLILIIFNAFVTYASKGYYICWVFYVISFFMCLNLFGIRYILEDMVLKEYFFFIPIRKIDIQEVTKVQVVTVKKIGSINIYIGKRANAVKEDGYYLIMNGDKKLKINSGYQNSFNETLGKYVINHYKKRYENIENYKWSNSRF